MKTFKNGPIADWKPTKGGSVLEFKSFKPRTVRFQIVANSAVEIWAGSKKDLSDAVLVASGDDKLGVEFTSNGDSYALIKAEKNAAVFINLPDLNQRVIESDNPSFTSIEPRIRRNTEFDRMMQYVKLNEQRRDASLASERATLRAEMARMQSLGTEVPQKEEPIVEEIPQDGTPTS